MNIPRRANSREILSESFPNGKLLAVFSDTAGGRTLNAVCTQMGRADCQATVIANQLAMRGALGVVNIGVVPLDWTEYETEGILLDARIFASFEVTAEVVENVQRGGESDLS